MVTRILNKLARLFWYSSAFFLWASFAPMSSSTDIAFALVPLVWLLRNGDVKTNVRRWFINGFLFWFLTLSWMPAIVKNGGPWPLVALGWLALSAYLALYFAAFGYLGAHVWSWVRPRGYCWRIAAILVVEPLLWAGLELVRSRFLGGFSWNQLGVAAVQAGYGSPAVLGGIPLVSACVFLVNGIFASIAERMIAPILAQRRRERVFTLGESTLRLNGGLRRADDGGESPVAGLAAVSRWKRPVETIVPFLALVALYSVSSRFVVRPGEGVETLSVALVQRNFPCVFSSGEGRVRACEAYAPLLERASLVKPDLVVLPESALAEFGQVGSVAGDRFAAWALGKSSAAALVCGGGRRSGGAEYNSAALYGVGGALRSVYDKVHLVPFGEFIPGDKLLPALQRFAPVGSCTSGELKTLDLDGAGPIGVAICYEDTDSAQIRELARRGARLLVFITNDSWFSHSDEAVAHAEQVAARAIETGLSVVRTGNSGVTGVVRADGRATWLSTDDGRSLVDRAGLYSGRVALAPRGAGPTPYVSWGDAPLAAAFSLLAAVMAIFFARSRLTAARKC